MTAVLEEAFAVIYRDPYKSRLNDKIGMELVIARSLTEAEHLFRKDYPNRHFIEAVWTGEPYEED